MPVLVSALVSVFVLFSLFFAQTLPDYVVKTSIIKWDGTQIDLNRADDPTGFAICVPNFGLLGVTIGEAEY